MDVITLSCAHCYAHNLCNRLQSDDHKYLCDPSHLNLRIAVVVGIATAVAISPFISLATSCAETKRVRNIHLDAVKVLSEMSRLFLHLRAHSPLSHIDIGSIHEILRSARHSQARSDYCNAPNSSFPNDGPSQILEIHPAYTG